MLHIALAAAGGALVGATVATTRRNNVDATRPAAIPVAQLPPTWLMPASVTSGIPLASNFDWSLHENGSNWTRWIDNRLGDTTYAPCDASLDTYIGIGNLTSNDRVVLSAEQRASLRWWPQLKWQELPQATADALEAHAADRSVKAAE